MGLLMQYRRIKNVVLLKLIEGTYEEILKVKINGIRGLGGFTLQETWGYLLNTKDNDCWVAYNFKNKQEAKYFLDELENNQVILTEKE